MKRAIGWLVVLSILLCAYVWWWQQGANRIKAHVEARLATLAPDGAVPAYDHLEVKGFPLSYEVLLTNPKVQWTDKGSGIEYKLSVDGFWSVGSSLLTDWAWAATSGHSEMKITLTTKEGRGIHWISSGDLKVWVHAPNFLDRNLHWDLEDFFSWGRRFYRGFSVKAQDFSLLNGNEPKNPPVFKLRDGFIDWDTTRNNKLADFTLSMDMNKAEFMTSSWVESYDNWAMKAHGTIPYHHDIAAFRWETVPLISLILDQSSVSSPMQSVTGQGKLILNNQDSFVTLDFMMDSFSETTKLWQAKTVRMLTDLAQTNLEQVKPEEKPLYLFLHEHISQIQGLVPDLSYFGKTRTGLQFHAKALKSAQPTQFPTQISLEGTKLHWETEHYGIIIEDELNYAEGLPLTGSGTIEISHYAQLLNDLTNYGLRWYRVWDSGARTASEQNISLASTQIVEKIKPFLVELSDPHAGADRLLIKIDAKDPEKIMIGPLNAAEAMNRLLQLLTEIVPILDPTIGYTL